MTRLVWKSQGIFPPAHTWPDFQMGGWIGQTTLGDNGTHVCGDWQDLVQKVFRDARSKVDGNFKCFSISNSRMLDSGMGRVAIQVNTIGLS